MMFYNEERDNSSRRNKIYKCAHLYGKCESIWCVRKEYALIVIKQYAKKSQNDMEHSHHKKVKLETVNKKTSKENSCQASVPAREDGQSLQLG